MVSGGRILYFLEKILPEENDTIISGYSGSQLEWCRKNEKEIWAFFISNNLLFTSDPNLLMKYVSDGPTTNGFPKEAPGNLGQFTGWQIVRTYMEKNKNITLRQLMEEKDMMKIFNKSMYKPAK
jgi:hypothetical protein